MANLAASVAKAAEADSGPLASSHPTLNRFDLEIAACHVLHCSRAYLLSHPERRLSSKELEQLNHWSQQLYDHVPLAIYAANRNFGPDPAS